jgi:hypothetical protein
VNRHERRKQASEARRVTKRDGIEPAQNTTSNAIDPVVHAGTRQIGEELTEESAIRAAATAAQAMDDALAHTWNAATIAPACKRGCSYCYTVPVSVTGPDLAAPGQNHPIDRLVPASSPATSSSTDTTAPSPRRGSTRKTTNCKKQRTSHFPIRRPSRAGSKDSRPSLAREATHRSIRGRYRLRARRAASKRARIQRAPSERAATRKYVDLRLRDGLAHGSREQEGRRRVGRDSGRHGRARRRTL